MTTATNIVINAIKQLSPKEMEYVLATAFAEVVPQQQNNNSATIKRKIRKKVLPIFDEEAMYLDFIKNFPYRKVPKDTGVQSASSIQ